MTRRNGADMKPQAFKVSSIVNESYENVNANVSNFYSLFKRSPLHCRPF